MSPIAEFSEILVDDSLVDLSLLSSGVGRIGYQLPWSGHLSRRDSAERFVRNLRAVFMRLLRTLASWCLSQDCNYLTTEHNSLHNILDAEEMFSRADTKPDCGWFVPGGCMYVVQVSGGAAFSIPVAPLTPFSRQRR